MLSWCSTEYIHNIKLEEASTRKSALTHAGNVLCLVTLTSNLLTPNETGV